MADAARIDSPRDIANNPLESLISHVMTPGSTVSPAFLLMVDVTLFSLLFLFISLLVLTWSLHFLALGAITLGLWGSVKLYVEELRKDHEPQSGDTTAVVFTDPVVHPAKSKDD